MADDVAALAADDQLRAETSERVNRAVMDASAITSFYRSLKNDELPASVVNALTYKYADWYLSAGYDADDEAAG